MNTLAATLHQQSSFTLRGRNPDVLTCIANLSNDEVFTPPELAGRMLDMVAQAWTADHKGANLWEDSRVRFLDPCTKSGVFLREVTKRLTEGLDSSFRLLRDLLLAFIAHGREFTEDDYELAIFA